MRPWLQGSLGVPTGDRQPQGTASSQARPKADAPSLGEAASSAWPSSEVRHGLCQCVCLRSDAILSPLSPVCCLSVARSVSPSVSASVCVCVCVCARARARICLSVYLYLPLTVLESISELPSLSASVSPDTRRPVRSSGPGLSQVLWLWLTRLRRRAVDRLCVCPCACLSLVCSRRKVVCLSGGVGERWGPQ